MRRTSLLFGRPRPFDSESVDGEPVDSEPVGNEAFGNDRPALIVRPADDAAVAAALDLARAARERGEVPIGAVVVSADGDVIGAGCNERETAHDPTGHAEVVALRAAGAALGSWRLTGCTLAVTLEPCTMCAGAAVLARVDRVVFGAWDPAYGAAGSLRDVLRDTRLNHNPEVVGGVREAECRALLDHFFADRR